MACRIYLNFNEIYAISSQKKILKGSFLLALRVEALFDFAISDLNPSSGFPSETVQLSFPT
jgi:hypothetical protein